MEEGGGGVCLEWHPSPQGWFVSKIGGSAIPELTEVKLHEMFVACNLQKLLKWLPF